MEDRKSQTLDHAEPTHHHRGVFVMGDDSSRNRDVVEDRFGHGGVLGLRAYRLGLFASPCWPTTKANRLGLPTPGLNLSPVVTIAVHAVEPRGDVQNLNCGSEWLWWRRDHHEAFQASSAASITDFGSDARRSTGRWSFR